MITELTTYGEEWPEKIQQADIELAMYLQSYEDGLLDNAFFHFKNAAQLLLPPKVYRWNYWTDKALHAFLREDFVIFWGAGGTGKSTTLGMILLIDWFADPINTTVKIYTTDLQKQKGRLLGEMIRMHDAVDNLPGDVVESRYQIRYKDSRGKIRKNAGIYGLSVKNDKGRIQKVSGFGIHNKRNRMVLDEMQGTPEAAFDTIDNFMMGGYDFKYIGIGNPETWDDLLGQYSRPKDNYTEWTPEKAEHQDDQWDIFINEQRLGLCVWFDGLKSPRIVEEDGEKNFAFLIGQKNIDKLRVIRTENSSQWWSQVRGFIRAGFAEGNSIITRETILFVRGHKRLPFDAGATSIMGVDPSYTEHGDEAIAIPAYAGKVPGGRFCLQMEHNDIRKLTIRGGNKLPVSHDLARQINDICASRGIDKHGLGLDTSATQTGPADVLQKDYGYWVQRVNFGGGASKIAWDPAEPKKAANEIYGSKVAELYFLAAALIEHGHVRGVYEQLINELTARRTFTKNGKKHVETKKEYISRMKASPNHADAFVVLCWLFLRRWKIRIGSGNILMKPPDELAAQLQQQEPSMVLESDFSSNEFISLS